jgi:tRNA threonylcarbamoyladenosine biosynthesis protein TsaB
MEPRFTAPEPGAASLSGRSSQLPFASRNSGDPAAGNVGAPLLLALSVHWDDCSVAVGTRAEITAESWSGQPERNLSSTDAGIAGDAVGAGSNPVASRDALLLVDRLLVRTDTTLAAVDRLCFARGPGAFTSLRVAAGLIQGLSLATSIPVAGICSLSALVAHEPAWRAEPATTFVQLSALDARMGECYFGVHLCRGGHYPEPLMAPSVGSPAAVIAVFDEVLARRAQGQAATAVVLAGNAFRLLPELAAWACRAGYDPYEAGGRAPDAGAVLSVAASAGAPEAGPAHTALPVYIRDKIALDVTEQRAGAVARALAAAGTQQSGARKARA